ncbi:MAG TPA: lysine--tRNA ligase [Candidatus Cloacimonadota bacterium]|nr:lysine--tRNA ligase [Candidatus Cloacimonadota bacterium]
MDNQSGQLLKLRREKLRKIIEQGINPYPVRAHRTHQIGELLQKKENWIKEGQSVSICGRLVAMRRQGKLGFGNVEDMSGKIQIYVAQNQVGESNYEVFKLCDPGDFIQADGTLFYTEAGEYSLKTSHITLLAKNLRPLPAVKEKIVDGKIIRYDEFSDIELRYRKRYLDLLLNPEHRRVFELRSLIIKGIRQFLDGRGFIEVETPILQPLYGGANARPFITHHNTLNTDLYLRIALELYLKRVIVGGFERVFEIGKNFRNEGMDRFHNPEFTMLELYQAYSDLEGMRELTETCIKYLAKNVVGKDTFRFQSKEVNLSGDWKQASMFDLVKEHTNLPLTEFNAPETEEILRRYCLEHQMEIPPDAQKGKLLALVFEQAAEDHIIQPTFVTDFPKEVSPLAKAKTDNPLLTERFELLIAGCEFANAFSELNDPVDQRARLEKQALMRQGGDAEAMCIDEDFLEAMEYGMPPMGGLGIGIDRLVMLLTENNSIKEVILFPQMKPE